MKIKACKYLPCPVSSITGRDCSKDCRTKIFYDRYGRDYIDNLFYNRIDDVESDLQLGVGAMMVPVSRPSDVGLDDEVDSQKSHKTQDI